MNKIFTKTKLVILLLILAVGGGIIWHLSSGEAEKSSTPQSAKKMKPPSVEVQPVRRGNIARNVELSGEIVAADSVVIAATKEGPISYCPWREGDTVEAGETLVEIDREVHRAEARQAEAALAVARAKLADLKAGTRPEEVRKAEADVRRRQATLHEARQEHARQDQLRVDDFTSQQSVDQARERLKVAEAELESTEENLRMLKAGPTETEIAVQAATVEEAAARLALAQAHLAECVIAAPFAGVITAVHVRPGDLVTPRSSLIEMYAPDSLVLRFAVPEIHSAAMRSGLELTVTLDSLPGQTFSAEIVRVYPHLDSPLRTRTVEAVLEKQEKLMPNQFARITLALASAEDAVIIPNEAVIESPQGRKFVFTVRNNQAERHPVKLGIQGKTEVQVVKGLDEGDQLVITGNENLKDKMPVRVTEAGQ